MTVSSQTSTATFVGNGVATAFPLPFRFFNNSDIRAYFIDSTTGAATAMAIGVDYTLMGAGEPEVDGSSLSLLTTTVPLASMRGLYVERVMPQVQETDIVNQGDFFASTHEDVFDRLTMLIQQSIGEGKGAIRVAIGDPEPARLSPAEQRANLLLGFDSFGNPIAVSPVSGSASDLALLLAGSTGSEHIGRGAGTVETALDALEADALAAKSPGFLKQQGDALHVLSGGTTGNTEAFDAALRTGTVRIAFAGDSIFEGLSQITYEDSPAGLFVAALRAQNPDVNFVVGNFSLASRAIGNLANISYVGTAGPDNPGTGFYREKGNAAYGLWPDGSTVGKPWIYHVRDFAPDMLIVAMGMNEASGDGAAIAASTKAVITESTTWTKPPSVALVASMLPSIANPPFPTAQVAVQIAADVMRSVAAETNASLIDANREFVLFRDAKDVVAKKYNLDVGFTNFLSNWSVVSGAFAESGGTTLVGKGGAVRTIQSVDSHIGAFFSAADYAVTSVSLGYRINFAELSGNQYYGGVFGGNKARLYFNLALVAEVTITTLINGDPVAIDIVCRGAHHQMWVNGVLVIDVWDYKKLTGGQSAVVVSGANDATVYNYSAKYGNPQTYGTPQLSETDLLGVNDWSTNPYSGSSAGGNGVNHPSKLGSLMAYGTAFRPLLAQAKNALAGGKVDVIYASSSDTTTAFDTPIDQIVGARIGGVAGFDSLAIGAIGNASAYADVYRRVAGGQTVVVDAFASQVGYVLAVNLVLPEGFWDVKAVASFAKNGQGYRNHLNVIATRCS